MRNTSFIFTLFLLAFFNFSIAQNGVVTGDLVSFPSPQSTEIARYGQVPVNYYNGLAGVSVPLFQFPVKGVNVSFNLSYHSGGVKPNAKGGWTGLGWSLNATGVITRIQNGMLDEHVNPNVSAPYDKCGYYWNKVTLNRSDWETPTALRSFLNRVVCQGAYGNSGNPSTHPTNPGCSDILVGLTDWAPDEFVFNFFGYSGSFWLDHQGNWVARESNGEKMSVELLGAVGQYTYAYPKFPGGVRDPDPKSVQYMFRGFVLKDGYGNSFEFGNSADNVELNRFQDGGTNLKATANSWYLKEIRTYYGEVVSFEYERKYPTISLNTSINSYRASLGSNLYATSNLQVLGGAVIDPVYLKKVTFNDYEFSLTYSESPLAQYTGMALSDGLTKLGYAKDARFYIVDDGFTAAPPKEFKIDRIDVKHGLFSKRFTFSYYDQIVSNRLFLKSITEGPIQSSPLVHQFEYNGTYFDPGADPQGRFYGGLLTTKVDHWGFYNAKFPVETSFLPVVNGFYQLSFSSYVPQGLLDTYIANRSPDETAMRIGSLKKIVYPTGGYTEFIYEPNSYAKRIDLNSTNTVSLGNDILAGGLRVSEIRSHPNIAISGTPLIRKFRYKQANGLSSGVLNSRGVIYEDKRNGSASVGNFSYSFFYDASQYPLLNTNGNHISYSRVEEIFENGSVKEYEFSNHDKPEHTDIAPFYALTSTDNAIFYLRFNNRDFSRGRLLKEQSYATNSSTPMSNIETLYENDDSAVMNKVGVRMYSLKEKDVIMMSFHRKGLLGSPAIFRQANIWEPNISSNLFYIHPYRPSQKITSQIENGDVLTTTENYRYNPDNFKIRELQYVNLSKGEQKSTRYLYSYDLSSLPVFEAMSNYSRNMINQVVQEESYLGNKLLVRQRTDYAFFNAGTQILPSAKMSVLYLNNWEVDLEIKAYDSKGNMLEAVPRSGVNQSYIWGYNFIFPIAKVINARVNDIAATSFETNSKGNWAYNDANVSSGVDGTPTGSNVYSLSIGGSIVSTNNFDNSKVYTVSYWSDSGPYQVSSSNSVKQGLSYNGWQYFEHKVVNPSSQVTISGVGKIDELRMYPKDAQMSTYTYRPLAGISSECDVNNRIVSYTYDNLNRLTLVKDQKGNILKRICYNYAGQQSNCQ